MIKTTISIIFKALGCILLAFCILTAIAVFFIAGESYSIKLAGAVCLIICGGIPAITSFHIAKRLRYIRIKIKKEGAGPAWVAKLKGSQSSEHSEKLKKLKALRKEGLITEGEYIRKKADISIKLAPVQKSPAYSPQIAGKLRLIKNLLAKELIVNSEYELKKKELLNQIEPVKPEQRAPPEPFDEFDLGLQSEPLEEELTLAEEFGIEERDLPEPPGSEEEDTDYKPEVSKKIKQIKELLDEGLITEDEYELKRIEILDQEEPDDYQFIIDM